MVAHGPVSTYTPVSLGSCGVGWIGVFTYIESLPTIIPTITGYPFFPSSSWLPARSAASSTSPDAKFTGLA